MVGDAGAATGDQISPIERRGGLAMDGDFGATDGHVRRARVTVSSEAPGSPHSFGNPCATCCGPDWIPPDHEVDRVTSEVTRSTYATASAPIHD